MLSLSYRPTSFCHGRAAVDTTFLLGGGGQMGADIAVYRMHGLDNDIMQCKRHKSLGRLS